MFVAVKSVSVAAGSHVPNPRCTVVTARAQQSITRLQLKGIDATRVAPEVLYVTGGAEIPLAEDTVRARHEYVHAVRAEPKFGYRQFVRRHQLHVTRLLLGVPQVYRIYIDNEFILRNRGIGIIMFVFSRCRYI